MAQTKALATTQDKATSAPQVDAATPTPEARRGPETAARERASPALPPSNGEPAEQRGARVLQFPQGGPGAPQRARMATALQGKVGNARMERMVGSGAPEQREDAAAETAAPPSKKEEPAAQPAPGTPKAGDKEAADRAQSQLSWWQRGLLWAFKKVAGALGIDAGFLIALFGRAASALVTLIRDPGKVLSFFGRAVKGAFKLLRTNFGALFMDALVAFVTGAAGGILIPKTWNLRSIAGLFVQLAGFTWDKLRGLLIKLLDIKRPELLEKAMEPIMAFLTGGASELLEQAKDHITGLYDKAKSALMSWLMKSVVTRFILKVAKFFIPGGGLLELVGMLWNAVRTVLRWAERIGGVVARIFESLAMIAEGKVEPAAQAIFGAIKGIFPVVVDFILGFLGLGNVVKTLRGFFKSMGDKLLAFIMPFLKIVAAGVRGLIGKAKGLFGKKERREQDPKERGSKLQAGLGALDKEEEAYEKQGAISRKDAERIAARVKAAHPVFKSLTVIDGGPTWDYEYAASPKNKKKGPKKSAGYEVLTNKAPDILTKVSPKRNDRSNFQKTEAGDKSNAYVANVPAGAKKYSSEKIASKYQEAFRNPDDALKRFRLVIGFNQLDEPNVDAEAAVREKVEASWTGFGLGVFGYVWVPVWKYNGKVLGRQAMKERMKKDHHKHEIEQALDQYKNKKNFPYGTFRQQIVGHDLTKEFINSFKDNQVHLFTGDPDVVSLRVEPASLEGQVDKLKTEEAASQTVDGILDRFDRVIKKAQGSGKDPVVASGGYDFRIPTNVSDAAPMGPELAKIAANILDMQIRTRLAGINPLAAYFPEPNMVVKAEKGKGGKWEIHGDFGVGAQEGRKFVKSIYKRREEQGQEFDVVFDREATLVTDSERFGVKTKLGSAEGTVQWFQGSLQGLTAEQVKSLFKQSQSHANFFGRNWISQIADGLGYRRDTKTVISQVQHHFTDDLKNHINTLGETGNDQWLNKLNKLSELPLIVEDTWINDFLDQQKKINGKDLDNATARTKVQEIASMAFATRKEIIRFLQKGFAEPD